MGYRLARWPGCWSWKDQNHLTRHICLYLSARVQLESFFMLLALTKPRWTRRQSAMTQVWCQHGAPLCIALQTDPACLVPDSVLLISPAEKSHWHLLIMHQLSLFSLGDMSNWCKISPCILRAIRGTGVFWVLCLCVRHWSHFDYVHILAFCFCLLRLLTAYALVASCTVRIWQTKLVNLASSHLLVDCWADLVLSSHL